MCSSDLVDSRQDPGSAFFMHSELPGDGITDGTSVLAINLSSKPLRRAVGHNRHIGPASLAVGNPLVDLLAGYVESATRLPENVEPALLGSISSHIVDLVALALGPTRDAAEQAAGGGLKSARLDAVLRVISERYAEPDFTVADVAAKLNLSVRYVQDILHETGNGFSERVLELRRPYQFDNACSDIAAVDPIAPRFVAGVHDFIAAHRTAQNLQRQRKRIAQGRQFARLRHPRRAARRHFDCKRRAFTDRKSTRLNSSHT